MGKLCNSTAFINIRCGRKVCLTNLGKARQSFAAQFFKEEQTCFSHTKTTYAEDDVIDLGPTTL